MRNVHKINNGNCSKDSISESDGSILMDGLQSTNGSTLSYKDNNSTNNDLNPSETPNFSLEHFAKIKQKLLGSEQNPFFSTNDADLDTPDESNSMMDTSTDQSQDTTSGSDKAQCKECNKSFVTNWHLRRHITEQHSTGQRFDCTQCSSSFKHERLLRNHLNTVHAGIKHKCQLCDKEYTEKYHLKRHFLSSHTETPTFSCNDCSFICKSSEKLEKHISRHKTLSCKKCDEKVTGIKKMKIHMEESHPVDNQFKCFFCLDLFESDELLKTHQLIHHKKRLNLLLTSASTNKKKQNLLKLLICIECDQKFDKKSELKAHNKEHHSVDLHISCLICAENFATKKLLLNHVQLTHGINNFECKECDMAFTTKYFLQRHNETVHPKEFPCYICNVDFKSIEEHTFHMEISHDLSAENLTDEDFNAQNFVDVEMAGLDIEIKPEPIDKSPIYGM